MTTPSVTTLQYTYPTTALAPFQCSMQATSHTCSRLSGCPCGQGQLWCCSCHWLSPLLVICVLSCTRCALQTPLDYSTLPGRTNYSGHCAMLQCRHCQTLETQSSNSVLTVPTQCYLSTSLSSVALSNPDQVCDAIEPSITVMFTPPMQRLNSQVHI